MTADHTSSTPPEEMTTVVVDLGRPPYDTPALELRGPLGPARLEAALDHLAADDPDAPVWRHRIDRLGHEHHALRLAADDVHTPGDAFPYGLLADLLTRSTPARPAPTLVPTPLQRELLADADALPGRHLAQLAWAWHGPLDSERFHTAWQSVVDHESVLRTAFDDSCEPLLVRHEHTDAEVLWLPHGTARWPDVLEDDRRRGIDPRRPGALRVTVLAGAPAPTPPAEPARVLLTYHHALLDDWSARLLLRAFYRAYLADGRLPGGERRPDLRDYVRWLRRQDTAPARDFWTRAVPPRTAAAWPARHTAPAPAPAGPVGRTRLRLSAAQTERLAAWAARWGSTESGALQAVWSLLLYRAGGARAAAPVRFSVTASGRGIPFEGAPRMPAALSTAWPLSVEVAPHSTVATLLSDLRDRILERSAYEWLSPGQIRSWTAPQHHAANGTRSPTGTEDGTHSPTGTEDGTLLVFENRFRDPDDLTAALAARGIRVEHPETLGTPTAFPLTLVAHHDGDEQLVLTAVHDRSRIADATDVLTHSALLLGELPYVADDSTTVADLLRLLPAADTTTTPASPPTPPTGAAHRADTRPHAQAQPPLLPLRAAADARAGTVCLLQTPHVPRARYDRLARAYQGPEAVILLRAVPGGPHARYTALRPLARAGRLLVLGGFSGGGSTAYEIARRIAAAGGRPPLTVLTGAATGADRLARLLETAAAQAGHPGRTG
ncbi:condensation domain-containing protein [Streptomyces sp. NBC_00481]|uniref:condensation domain-containing protein n=1 Tax=Streptomyces sp. NBC_00481 TaxID=2975755 RepID=UPI002DDAF894|nr:condensation domain-containing protein [Streptomyces sp. NBC_00481]WRY93249.1 condensation domain-containing protein [Streptomyces sp. NBC_00481]WRZ01093.1 condensation domain-containing protein [Streptomyces sp. NBC_00481]